MQQEQIAVSEEAAKLAPLSYFSGLVDDAERHPRTAAVDFHFYHHPRLPTLVVVIITGGTTSVLTEQEASDLKARLQAESRRHKEVGNDLLNVEGDMNVGGSNEPLLDDEGGGS